MASAPKGGTEKDQKVAMPGAAKSDKKLSIRRRYGATTYGCRDTDDEGEEGLYDERF